MGHPQRIKLTPPSHTHLPTHHLTTHHLPEKKMSHALINKITQEVDLIKFLVVP